MNSPLLLLLLLLLIIIIPLSSSLPISLWPQPTKVQWPHPSASPLSPLFKIHSPFNHHPSISYYSHLLLHHHHYHPILPPSPLNFTLFPLITSLSISISRFPSPLQPPLDESYTLSVPSNPNSNSNSSGGTASLTATTLWGAIHGLETFTQLIWGDPPVVAAGILIQDGPRFPHRGVLLDTSRNFYPKKDILRTIDAMAMNKLNVFHWHVTDSHSFPIVLPSEKGLADEGAYGVGMRYEVEDVKEIVEYGLRRGVRVMPEIDMPG